MTLILSLIKVEVHWSAALNSSGVASLSPILASHSLWMVNIYSVWFDGSTNMLNRAPWTQQSYTCAILSHVGPWHILVLMTYKKGFQLFKKNLYAK